MFHLQGLKRLTLTTLIDRAFQPQKEMGRGQSKGREAQTVEEVQAVLNHFTCLLTSSIFSANTTRLFVPSVLAFAAVRGSWWGCRIQPFLFTI
jgi:hypothetical protein